MANQRKIDKERSKTRHIWSQLGHLWRPVAVFGQSECSEKMKTKSKIGTEKVTKEDLVVFCPNDKTTRDGEEYCRPGYTVDRSWEDFNLCKEVD